MYARVATWEGGDAEAMRKGAERMNADAASGPPEGVPAVGFLMLMDPEKGRSMAIALFETEEDLRKGDETLTAMNPPDNATGRRTAVDTYEVGADFRL
jgi:hypothetical protein